MFLEWEKRQSFPITCRYISLRYKTTMIDRNSYEAQLAATQNIQMGVLMETETRRMLYRCCPTKNTQQKPSNQFQKLISSSSFFRNSIFNFRLLIKLHRNSNDSSQIFPLLIIILLKCFFFFNANAGNNSSHNFFLP